MKKRATPNKEVARPKTQSDSTFNSAKSQRERLLAWLREKPITTLEARKELDVLMPAARIKELRNKGYSIDTIRVDRPTDCGRFHSVALYALIREASHA